MPLYEYECEKCHKRVERIEKFSGPHLRTCPSCGGRVTQLISAPAIQFKGSGWYVTDYAKSSGGASDTQSNAGAAGGEAKTDAKTETSKETSAAKGKKKPAAKEK